MFYKDILYTHLHSTESLATENVFLLSFGFDSQNTMNFLYIEQLYLLLHLRDYLQDKLFFDFCYILFQLLLSLFLHKPRFLRK